MKDWKEWFDVSDTALCHGYDTMEEERYQAYKARLIEEGFIEANPKRWVRPNSEDVTLYFIDKIGRGRDSVDMADSFMNHWDSVDWYTKGKVRIKSWKGRANTWIKNNEKFKRNDSQRFNGESAADKTAASIANRNR